MNFFDLYLLEALFLFFTFAFGTHKDGSLNVPTTPLNKPDLQGDVLLCIRPNFDECLTVQYNITIPDPPKWPCEALPEAVWENLGSIAPDAGVICRLWSQPSCQETNLLAVTYKPGEDDLFAEWQGMVDRGREARYIGCLECQNCQ